MRPKMSIDLTKLKRKNNLMKLLMLSMEFKIQYLSKTKELKEKLKY